MTSWAQRYEDSNEALRVAQTLLIAAREAGGLDHLPADPALHDAANRSMRLLFLAEDQINAFLTKEEALSRAAHDNR